MRFKVYRFSLIAIIILVIIASIFAFNYSDKNKLYSGENAVNATEFMYCLKEYDGKIGVYKENNESPFMIIDVYVENLPAVDRQELKGGIMVQNDDKLKMIIEDYES